MVDEFALGPRVEHVFAEIAAAIELGLYVYEVDDPTDPGSLRLVYANPASVAATGVPFEAIIGRPIREAFPALLATTLPRIYLDIALGGAVQEIGDVSYGDERVSEQVFSVRAFPLPNRSVGVSFTNLTPLRAAEQRAVETLESMSDAFVTLDREWRFTYVNPQSEAILDRRREDLLGKVLWDEFPAAVDSRFSEAYHRAVREQVPVTFEESYEPLGRTLDVRAYPIQSGLAVYFRDVTRERRLDTQLRQTQRLEAIGRVTAGIAHDFNNLLTAIRGFASLGRIGSHDRDGTRYFEEIEAAALKSAELTRQLLVFGREQRLSPAVIDANDVVAGMESLLRQLTPSQVELRLELSPEPVPVFADRSQLEQVLVNLVINSRDAIDGSGTVTVSTTSSRPSDIERDVGMTSAWFQVADTGCGIAEDTKPHIFEPFFSTKPPETGSGLGLATIYGIIAQSGGEIFVDSTVGVGTTMTVVLPAHAPDASHGTDLLDVDPDSTDASVAR